MKKFVSEMPDAEPTVEKQGSESKELAKPMAKLENLIEEEEKVTGQVSFRDYRNYWNYSLGVCGILLYVFLCILAAIVQLSISLQLTEWSNQPLEEQQNDYYPKMLGALIGFNLLVAWIRESTIIKLVITSNSNLHKAMSLTIVRAKILFFDSNPIGRILTRFSKDLALLDLLLPNALAISSYGMFRTIMGTISLSIVNFWLLIPVLLIGIYFAYVARTASVALTEA